MAFSVSAQGFLHILYISNATWFISGAGPIQVCHCCGIQMQDGEVSVTVGRAYGLEVFDWVEGRKQAARE
jgi:hypothetical protein